MPAHSHHPPFDHQLPSPIYFRSAHMPAGATYPHHAHPWGEFVYSFSGVMEVKVGSRHYLAPQQYAIWLPPGLAHQGLNRHQACHCSLYVVAEHCDELPRGVCALTVSPLLRALLEHLHQSPPALPFTAEDQRLLQVVVDQIRQAECAGSFLPTSEDPLLGHILQTLDDHPGDTRSLAEWAHQLGTSERTLMRYCLRDLGMSFADWRQRRRVIAAMRALEQGETVEKIARDLNYRSASAFIAMFRRQMGITPDEYRKGAG
ncbi:transcriptional regulator, AraC family [Insolitispirillum peregrinum]|uniref:Transcriptional regulator, AraC family n=2 Tax=Insolitispirillum peregrinum TaxID=80876 RepID=A0A1N7LHX7_9PROT|nr:transcriptional regulator, AraC family [Insolitispirillum peregrinum]